MTNPKAENRVAILSRISTVAQDTTAQTEQLIELAIKQNYLVEESDIYEDIISGYTKFETRPSLNRLLSNIREGKKKYVMCFVYDMSRISRSVVESQKIMHQFFELKVPLFVKAQMICSHENGEPSLMFSILSNMLANFANVDAESMKMRFSRGHQHSMKNFGAGRGVMMPFGYKKVKKGKSIKLVVDPEESQVVKRIYDYALNGHGIKTICDILNSEGIKTKTQKVIKKGSIRKSDGSYKSVQLMRWEEGTLQSILTNSIYIGERKTSCGIVKSIAIINKDVWTQVQELRTAKFQTRARNHRYLYLLTGVVKCAKCGRNMYGRYRPHGTDCFYQCSSKRVRSCGNVSINIEALESVIFDVLSSHPKQYSQYVDCSSKLKDTQDKIHFLLEEIKLSEQQMFQFETEKKLELKLFTKALRTEIELDQAIENINRKIELKGAKIQSMKTQVKSMTIFLNRINKLEEYEKYMNIIKNDRFQIIQMIHTLVEKISVRSVSSDHNNYKYVVALFLKGESDPICLMIETKQRNQHNDSFIEPAIAKWAQQSRFKYVNSGQLDDSCISYSTSGTLITDIKEAYDTIVLSFENGVEGFADYHIPPLLKFVEDNAIVQVSAIKKAMKRRAA